MKKFFVILATVALMMLQSCDSKFGVEYAVTAKGDALGDVEFVFPQGTFDANGTVAVNFNMSNMTGKLKVNKVMDLNDGLRSNDTEIYEAACNVDEWLDDNFGVSAAKGTYYVFLEGTVVETLTKIEFHVKREFTNRTEDENLLHRN